ncbi:MAG: hypothetical protein ACJ8CR_08260 [Roseiflexaceae bacterium]
MNDRAAAYLAKHGVMVELNGTVELMLPLDKLQGFLDLLQPSDVPPEKLQTLYRWQAEAMSAIQAQVAQFDAGAQARANDDREA